MNQTAHNHPADRALVSVVTGDTTAAGVRAHLDGCARCRMRVERMQSAEARMAGLFAAVPDLPVPSLRTPRSTAAMQPSPARVERASRATRRYAGAAAAVACLLLIVAVPELRALLLQPLIDRLTATSQEQNPATSALPAGAELRLGFPVRDSVLIVEMAATQRAGRITITAHAGDLALLRSTASAGTHDVDVGVGRVSIANRNSDEASYDLFIPPNIRTRLFVAATEIPVIFDGTGGFEWSFDAPAR